MKLLEIATMPRATSKKELVASVHNGRFTLDGSKLKVQEFTCEYLGLTSLVGCPGYVAASFRAAHNLLTTLEGGPYFVGGRCDVHNNNLRSLAGAPSHVGSMAAFRYNSLTTLHNVHLYLPEINGAVEFTMNKIRSNVLGLLKIKGLREVYLDNNNLEAIINKYLPLGDLFDCQEELIEAGFEVYAQL